MIDGRNWKIDECFDFRLTSYTQSSILMKVRNSNFPMVTTQIATEEIVRLQQKGLVTIPKKFRVQLNIEENDLLRLKNEKGRIILEPVRTYTEKEIKEFLALGKAETKMLKKKKSHNMSLRGVRSSI